LIVQYVLVDADTSYNALIDHWTLNQLGAIVSMWHSLSRMVHSLC